MGSSLLQLAQKVRGELSLSVPTAVASSADTDIQNTLALMNAAGEELVNCKPSLPWNALNVEYRFTTQYSTQTGTLDGSTAVVTGLSSTTGLDTTYMAVGNGIPQDTYVKTVDSATQVTLSQNTTIAGTPTISFCKVQYALPSDYKAMVDRTQWDKSKHWEMLGPEDGQQWQWLKSGYIATGPRIRWRLMGNMFQIWPPIATPEYLGFEYISNGWARSSSGALQTAFLADTDTCIYPDRLIIIASKIKYWLLKGFDASIFQPEYQRELAVAIANDTGSPLLSFAPKPAEILIGYENIPDSGYGTL